MPRMAKARHVDGGSVLPLWNCSLLREGTSAPLTGFRSAGHSRMRNRIRHGPAHPRGSSLGVRKGWLIAIDSTRPMDISVGVSLDI